MIHTESIVCIALAAALATAIPGAHAADDPTATDKSKAPPARTKPDKPSKADKPIARLGDETISLADVQPDIAFQVYRQRVDVYALLVRAVNDLVERRLLEQEAKRRSISVEELLRLLEAEAEPATPADIDAYLAKTPGAAAEPNAHERVAYYLTEQRRIQARLDFVDALRRGTRFEMLLQPPEQPRVQIATEGFPARGPKDAPLVVVHFASFAQDRAAGSADYLRRLERELPDQVRWVHRSLPRDRDEVGLAAAQLAAAADEKGKFWEAHDRLFEQRGNLKPADLERIASELGIPPVRLGDTTYLKAVRLDIDEARRIGIEEGPVMFVNGRYFSPTFPYAQLRALADDELAGKSLASTPEDTK